MPEPAAQRHDEYWNNNKANTWHCVKHLLVPWQCSQLLHWPELLQLFCKQACLCTGVHPGPGHFLCMISLQSGAPAKISRNVIDNAHTSVLSLHNSPNLKHLQNLNHTQWPNCVQHFWIVWSTALCLCEWHCNGQAWINLCLCIASSTCAFLGYAYNWICICHSSTVTNTQWHTHTHTSFEAFHLQIQANQHDIVKHKS